MTNSNYTQTGLFWFGTLNDYLMVEIESRILSRFDQLTIRIYDLLFWVQMLSFRKFLGVRDVEGIHAAAPRFSGSALDLILERDLILKVLLPFKHRL